jgi:hypothetical protein
VKLLLVLLDDGATVTKPVVVVVSFVALPLPFPLVTVTTPPLLPPVVTVNTPSGFVGVAVKVTVPPPLGPVPAPVPEPVPGSPPIVRSLTLIETNVVVKMFVVVVCGTYNTLTAVVTSYVVAKELREGTYVLTVVRNS